MYIELRKKLTLDIIPVITKPLISSSKLDSFTNCYNTSSTQFLKIQLPAEFGHTCGGQFLHILSANYQDMADSYIPIY